jgi:outer membrane usher protein
VTEIFLSVHINERDMQHVARFLQDDDNNIFIHEDDLERFELHPPSIFPVIYNDEIYYSAAAFGEHVYQLDQQHLSIDFDIPTEFFKTRTLLADKTEFVTATKPDIGGFFNYDMLAQQAPDATNLSGLFLPGVFTAYGTGVSEFLAQDDEENTGITRLNSTWQIDYPETMHTFQLGDSFSTPGLWGNSVDFGGIQWGTNYGTQPTFITFPLPSVSGEAVVPSIVDLYLNNALLDAEAVPPGPFTINEIPVITGAGTLDVLTTDLLGRQQLVNLSYYGASNLLKPGLHDYSVEVGFIRENFGIESNDYGQFMTVATDAYGITETFTSEWRIEGLLEQQTVGLGGNYLFDNFGVFTLASAGSQSELGMGALGELGFQRQAINEINYGFNVIATTAEFTQIGFGEEQPAPAFQSQYYAGKSNETYGSLSMNYIQQNNRNTDNVGFISANYYHTLWDKWSLSISTLTHVKGSSNNGIFVTFSRLFGERTNVNLGAQTQNNSDPQGTVQLTQYLPLGPGWGYNLYAAPGENENYQASLSAQNDYGTYTAAVAQQYGETGYQLQTQGALAIIDNDLYFSRFLGESFGVVQVPGQEDIQVYNFNQVIGATNKDGKLFMPNLLPYQNNSVGIEPDDLPIGVEIQTSEINAIPYFQSGLLVTFPIESAHSAIAQLVDIMGNPLPAGTPVETVGDENTMMVAEHGEVYLTQLNIGNNTFKAMQNDIECVFSIDYKVRPDDPIPDLGILICKE